jgi:septum formation protein
LTAFPLILASGSPRRRTFMELLGLPFEVHVADVDERSLPGESPAGLVARLARAKAQAVAGRFPRAAVIGADTIVTLEGEILGKPADAGEAAAMLRRLRDRAHRVYSGVCVVPPGDRRPAVSVVESTVWMRAYAEIEIAAYVASGSPLDKAGAYGIQDAGFHPVARLEGCYASVMGLPLCHVARLLDRVNGGRAALLPQVPALCSAANGVPCCGGERAELVLEGQTL